MPTRLRRHHQARARRRRLVLASALSLAAAAAGGSLYVAYGHRLLNHYLATPASAPTQTAAILRSVSPCPATTAGTGARTRPMTAGTAAPASPGTARQGPASPGPAVQAPAGQGPARPASPGAGGRALTGPALPACPGPPAAVSVAQPVQAAPRPGWSPAGPGASPSPSGSGPPAGGPPPMAYRAVQQVLTLINETRIQDELPPYTLSSGLGRSAAEAAHTARMAAGCGLTHQCPGEPALGARETAAGVRWTAAGENIGEGGPEPATPAALAKMATTLTQAMLNERAPRDGHRRNLLSRTFHHIGIAIVRDSRGNVWMTQDFSS